MATEFYSTLLARAWQYGASLEKLLDENSKSLQELAPTIRTCNSLEKITEKVNLWHKICSQVRRDTTPLAFIFLRATCQQVNKLFISDIEYQTLKDLGHNVQAIQTSLLSLKKEATKLSEFVTNLEITAQNFCKQEKAIQKELSQAKRKEKEKGKTFLSRIFGCDERTILPTALDTPNASQKKSKEYEINDSSDFEALLQFSDPLIPSENRESNSVISITNNLSLRQSLPADFQTNPLQKLVISNMRKVLESSRADLSQMDPKQIFQYLSSLRKERGNHVYHTIHLDPDQINPDTSKALGENLRASFVEQRNDAEERYEEITTNIEKARTWYSVFTSHHLSRSFILTPETEKTLRRLHFQVEDLQVILQYEEATKKISKYLEQASILMPKIQKELAHSPEKISWLDKLKTNKSPIPRRRHTSPGSSKSATPSHKDRDDRPILSIGSSDCCTPTRVPHYVRSERDGLTPEDSTSHQGSKTPRHRDLL